MNTLLVFVVVVLYINNLNLAEVSESPTMPCFLLPFLVLSMPLRSLSVRCVRVERNEAE